MSLSFGFSGCLCTTALTLPGPLFLLGHREVKLRRPVFHLQVRRQLSEVQEMHGLVATVFAGGFVGMCSASPSVARDRPDMGPKAPCVPR